MAITNQIKSKVSGLAQRLDINKKERTVAEWRKNPTVPPPHEVKQILVLSYAMRKNLDTLVETGTYLGMMMDAQKDYFKKLYSIELSKDLHSRAASKYRNHPQIEFIQGDSSDKLGELIPKLTGPVLFWLDGHYSGGVTALGEKECPIFEELEHVKKSPYKNTVLIDDARLFVGGAYPTVEELEEFLGTTLTVENDMIVWEQ